MSYAINVCVFSGRIPESDKIKYAFSYYPGSENKRSYFTGKLSIPTRKENKDDPYPKTMLMTFKAWGNQADFINNYFKPGDYVMIKGEMDETERTETEDGKQIWPEKYIIVQDIIHQRGSAREDASSVNTVSVTSAPKKSTTPPMKRPNLGGSGFKLKPPF